MPKHKGKKREISIHKVPQVELSHDLLFIAGDFLRDCLPKDKHYLYQYFTTKVQRSFLNYVHLFNDMRFFNEHTGSVGEKKNLYMFHDKLKTIEQAHRNAKANMDFEQLEDIEKGKFKTFYTHGRRKPPCP